MKKLLLLLLAMPMLGIGQAEQNFERIPDAEINPQRLAFVSSLTDRILLAQQGGGFYRLSAQEADVAMQNGLTEAIQKQAYAQLKGTFGEYQGLVFDEMLIPREGTSYEIYRFRGQFGSSGTGVEIRAVLNPEGKLSGFYYKPWNDRL